jgi:hypothetical protein
MDESQRLRQLTKLERRGVEPDPPRFALEWALPLEPGLQTHVTLSGSQRVPPEIVARGHGADEVEALRDLWRNLTKRDAPNEALTVVGEAYLRRTGRSPMTPRSPVGRRGFSIKALVGWFKKFLTPASAQQ